MPDLVANPPKIGRPRKDRPKKQITLRLDPDIVEHFRGTGKGWQSRINEALRDAMRRRKQAS
ncbi:MAG: BrnA antitoxin family protein [Pseudomonadota bacterium]